MHTRPATRQDLPNIADVVGKAMLTDEISLWLAPTSPEHPHLHRETFLRNTIRRWNSGAIMLVTLTEPGDDGWTGSPQIVAYAAYAKEVGAPDDTSKRATSWSQAFERFLFGLGDTYNWYFRGNLNNDRARMTEFGQVIQSDKTFSLYPNHWELYFLAVDPAFGRRGLGSQLIEWGQQRATEDGVPLLLWSSQQGEPLYLRKGFKEIAKLPFNAPVQPAILKWDSPNTAASKTQEAEAATSADPMLG